jgi:hypothetical protein
LQRGLEVGTYKLITSGGITGTLNSADLGGSLGAAFNGALQITGNDLELVVSVPPAPATLTNSLSGPQLSLAWPAGQGWRLQQQTNALSVGLSTNWVDVTDSSVSSTNITVDPAQPATFYRLAFP